MDFLIFIGFIVMFIGFCWNTHRVNELRDDLFSLLEKRWEDCD